VSAAAQLVALWRLARPRLMPYLLFLPLIGFGWAHWDRALPLRGATLLPAVLAAWALLQAGTLWLNAALDRDQGEVLMGRAVPTPPGVQFWGYAALLLAVAVAALAGPVAAAAALACAVLSVLYSHPRTAWKGHPIFGPLVNWVGYGLLSPLAGWSVVGVGPDARSVIAWLLGSLGVLGCYFAAQAFQRDEDAARGYRTLVATHGPRGALTAARICLDLGFLGGTVLAVIGWLPYVCLVAWPLGLWVDSWLRRWARQPDGGGERWARGMALRLLVSAALAIALAYADYFWALANERPVAGLGTARGHPTDRPDDRSEY
jgi:4-hydroxybenzoate polyprenyltransferase